MDMNFRWNRGGGQAALDNAEAEYLKAQAAAATASLAGARPEAAAYAENTPVSYYRNKPEGDFNALMNQAMGVQNAAMADQAQRTAALQRFQELEAERNDYLAKQKAFIENPNTQMAIGMALGGQPGVLMNLIMERGKGDAGQVSQYQEKMDNLETDMLRAISSLGEFKPSDRRNFQQMMKVMFPSKFDELESKGAVSRMGGWPAWLAFLGSTQEEVDAAKAEAERKKNRNSRIRVVEK